MLRDCDAVAAVIDPAVKSGGAVHAVRAAEGHIPMIRINPRHREVTSGWRVGACGLYA